MKKVVCLITILAVGLLSFTQVHAQKNGQYVLDDNGYHITVVDKTGNTQLVEVATKDVPWIIRFNPSSTLAGIVDNRTSVLRRFKRDVAAILSTTIVGVLLKKYFLKKQSELQTFTREQYHKREENYDQRGLKAVTKRTPIFYDQRLYKEKN